MKLNVKELQALDTMLHAYSYLSFGPGEKSKKYMLVVKIDDKLIKCNFLHFQNDEFYPVQSNPSYNGEKGYKRISNNSLFESFADLIQSSINGYSKDLSRFKNTSDLLIDELLELITKEKLDKYPDFKSNKIYNVTFLESNIVLDFCLIDPTLEYELLTIILESKN